MSNDEDGVRMSWLRNDVLQVPWGGDKTQLSVARHERWPIAVTTGIKVLAGSCL